VLGRLPEGRIPDPLAGAFEVGSPVEGGDLSRHVREGQRGTDTCAANPPCYRAPCPIRPPPRCQSRDRHRWSFFAAA